MNSVLVNLENSRPEGYARYYYYWCTYKYVTQTGYEPGNEKFSLKETDRGYIVVNNLIGLVESLQDWIMGETAPYEDEEDIQEILKIEFYYLDVQDKDSKKFCSRSVSDQVAMIKQYGVEASPQEYEALKKELYLID